MSVISDDRSVVFDYRWAIVNRLTCWIRSGLSRLGRGPAFTPPPRSQQYQFSSKSPAIHKRRRASRPARQLMDQREIISLWPNVFTPFLSPYLDNLMEPRSGSFVRSLCVSVCVCVFRLADTTPDGTMVLNYDGASGERISPQIEQLPRRDDLFHVFSDAPPVAVISLP